MLLKDFDDLLIIWNKINRWVKILGGFSMEIRSKTLANLIVKFVNF